MKNNEASRRREMMVGYQVRAGVPLGQALEYAQISENTKPAQYYIDLVNEAAKNDPLKAKNQLRAYENCIGYSLIAGASLEQAKAEWETWRVSSDLPDIDKPAQFFLDLVMQRLANAKPTA